MASEVASLFVRFFAKDDGVKQEFETIQREAERTASQVHSHAQRMASAFQTAGERMRGTGETLIDMGDNLSQALSLPFIVVGGAAVTAAFQTDQAMSIINANFGNNAQLAAAYGNIVQNALRSGVAESAQQAALDVVTLAQTFGRLNPQTMQVVAQKAQAMAMAMGTSVDDIANRAKELKDTFGISLSQALDLVARGFDADKVKAVGLKNALEQSRGAAQRMTQEMLNSPMAQLRGQWNQLLQSLVPLGGVLLNLANQVLPRITAAVQSAAQWFQGLSDSQQNLVIGIGLLAVALPPVIMFFGALAMSAGALVSALGTLAGIIGTITAPIWAVIAAVAALAAVFVVLWNRSAAFRTFFLQVWNSIKVGVVAAWNFIRSTIMTVLNAVVSFVRSQLNVIRVWWNQSGSQIMAAVRRVWGWIRPYISSSMSTIVNAIRSGWNIVKSVTSTLWNAVKIVVSTALKVVLSLVKATAQAINGNWRGALQSLYSATGTLLHGVWGLFNTLLGGLPAKALAWGRNLMNMFISGIESMFGRLESIASHAASIVSDFLGFHSPTEKGPASDSDRWAPNFVDMYAQGLERGVPKIASVVNSMAESMSALSAPHTSGSSTLPGHTFNINVYTDDRRTGRTIARTINRELWLHA